VRGNQVSMLWGDRFTWRACAEAGQLWQVVCSSRLVLRTDMRACGCCHPADDVLKFLVRSPDLLQADKAANCRAVMGLLSQQLQAGSQDLRRFLLRSKPLPTVCTPKPVLRCKRANTHLARLLCTSTSFLLAGT
jgi:hypothetical protein